MGVASQNSRSLRDSYGSALTYSGCRQYVNVLLGMLLVQPALMGFQWLLLLCRVHTRRPAGCRHVFLTGPGCFFLTPRPVQGAGSFGLRISQYPSLFAADKEGTLPTGVSRSFGTRTRGGGTEADNSFPVSLNPVQELVARPLRSLAVQAPRWWKNEAGVRVMTACLTQAEEVARTYRVALGISMHWRSSLAALR